LALICYLFKLSKAAQRSRAVWAGCCFSNRQRIVLNAKLLRPACFIAKITLRFTWELGQAVDWKHTT